MSDNPPPEAFRRAVKDEGVTSSSVAVDRAWSVNLRLALSEGRARRTRVVVETTGNTAPSTAEVVAVLIRAWALGDCTFATYCEKTGKDTDSRRAFSAWKRAKTHRQKVCDWLDYPQAARLRDAFDS